MPIRRMTTSLLVAAAFGTSLPPAMAQDAPPPAVGVQRVESRPFTESTEYLGRVQATEQVQIQPRLTAFLTKRMFTEGAEVKKGDLLYVLEQGPFQAVREAREAAVKEAEAQLRNAALTLERAEQLLKTSSGTQASFDNAQATKLAQEAVVLSAKAQLRQAQIDLDYSEIRSPIDGKIGRTSVTEGNVVSPSSGALTTVVSQDPMYVTFSVPVRAALDIRRRLSGGSGFGALQVRVRLPDGRIYEHVGKLDFLNNSVTSNTDTLMLRAVVANPARGTANAVGTERELIDAEFVTVLLEGATPVSRITIPQSALLTDQEGSYVFLVDAEKTARRRSIKLGRSGPNGQVVVENGLAVGDRLVVEGLQRIRNGQVVSPADADHVASVSSKADQK
ncbi:hemolysin D [Azorhizobium oxalatiphilum]|uniref:Hemolysin D n=1 Tax=Azorhizobium oxalatiphilum TaxID=980631 RepID=A0A917FF22_9HYPH|nr:efflux RND transporter periplasmic adaptor subunit [Azorhizobium oxalatiphilum]GGF71750.1 hemolysin D [Azorhizobium oxalatiphilum]